MITLKATGLVYRNPKPWLRSVHTWHPSIARFDDGELVAAFDVGQAVEAMDYHTVVSRSADGGATWSPPIPLFRDPVTRPSTHSVRISRMADGTLVAVGARMYRDDPEEGVTNKANLGYVPMDLIMLTSRDRGRTWQGPVTVRAPLVGPAFETCHWVVELRDGRWLWPTSTWRGWNGEMPNGMKALALVSRDRGKTWPEYIEIMNGDKDGVIYWEQSLVQLPDDRLLVVAWVFDEKKGRSEPNRYVVSTDGRTFSAPRPTGFHGQTAKIKLLPDGRILCLYRGDAKPGLWANVARIDGDTWTTLEETVIWQGAKSGMTGEGRSAEELSDLRFGFPSMVILPDGDVLAIFWCCEDGINNVRWLRIGVSA